MSPGCVHAHLEHGRPRRSAPSAAASAAARSRCSRWPVAQHVPARAEHLRGLLLGRCLGQRSGHANDERLEPIAPRGSGAAQRHERVIDADDRDIVDAGRARLAVGLPRARPRRVEPRRRRTDGHPCARRAGRRMRCPARRGASQRHRRESAASRCAARRLRLPLRATRSRTMGSRPRARGQPRRAIFASRAIWGRQQRPLTGSLCMPVAASRPAGRPERSGLALGSVVSLGRCLRTVVARQRRDVERRIAAIATRRHSSFEVICEGHAPADLARAGSCRGCARG